MNSNSINVLLADDDQDDCLLFKDALEELPFAANLTTVYDGEQLMSRLLERKELPEIIFLDLNMPRKNGLECLSEIKLHEQLRHLPVIIISTSFDDDMVELLYKNGAHYYICKPNEFQQLKKLIHNAVSFATRDELTQPSPENFVLHF